MKRRNNFLQQLQQRRQEAATTAPAELKPISEMTEEELDEEAERIRGELRRTKEEEVAAAREEQASGNRWPFPRRKTRRPWK
jgi:hypothetical protein